MIPSLVTMQFLIVGLGNPEKKYERTRHNAGFMAVDALASELHAPEFKFKKSLNALVTECQIDLSTSVILAKPHTFMNLSGTSVAALLTYYKITDPTKHLIIISDDLDLPSGTIRYRPRGSGGGHNGLKSVIDTLHTQEFPRLKIGICPLGAARQPGKAEDFVLERFTGEELIQLRETVFPHAVQAILERIENYESGITASDKTADPKLNS